MFVDFHVFVDFVCVCVCLCTFCEEEAALLGWPTDLSGGSILVCILFVFMCLSDLFSHKCILVCLCILCGFCTFCEERLLWLLWPTDLSGGQNQAGSLLKINLPKNQHFSKSNIGRRLFLEQLV